MGVAQELGMAGGLPDKDVVLAWGWLVAGQVLWGARIALGVPRGIRWLGMVLGWFGVPQRVARLLRMMRGMKILRADRNNLGGEGGRGGIWVIGSSGPGRGVATCGTVGSMIGDAGVGAGGGTVMVGPGVDEGNAPAHAPNVRCVDGVCLHPHADFLLASLAFFRIALSVSMNSLSFSMFPYFE